MARNQNLDRQHRTRFSIRKNDRVWVISGKNKGSSGKVLIVDSRTGKITVEKINLAKRHMKTSQKNPQGGIMEKELPLEYSNVLLLCPRCNKGVRHGTKWKDVPGKGKKTSSPKKKQKIRFCKKCDGTLEF